MMASSPGAVRRGRGRDRHPRQAARRERRAARLRALGAVEPDARRRAGLAQRRGRDRRGGGGGGPGGSRGRAAARLRRAGRVALGRAARGVPGAEPVRLRDRRRERRPRRADRRAGRRPRLGGGGGHRHRRAPTAPRRARDGAGRLGLPGRRRGLGRLDRPPRRAGLPAPSRRTAPGPLGALPGARGPARCRTRGGARLAARRRRHALRSARPLVVAAAEAGDALACRILEEAASEVAATIGALDRGGPGGPGAPGDPVALTGGLAPVLAGRLPRPIRDRLVPARGTALDGALKVLMGLAPAEAAA